MAAKPILPWVSYPWAVLGFAEVLAVYIVVPLAEMRSISILISGSQRVNVGTHIVSQTLEFGTMKMKFYPAPISVLVRCKYANDIVKLNSLFASSNVLF